MYDLAQRVELQRRVQAERVTVGGEAGVQPLEPDPQPPLGGPQRGPVGVPHPGTHLGDPLLDDDRRPQPDGQHAAALGRRALLRLPVSHHQGAVVAELPTVRVGAEVDLVEHAGLVAAQAIAVGRLEQRRVPERRQPALASLAPDAHHLLVGVVEERLQLGSSEGAVLGFALAFVGMYRRVPVVDHLDRVRPEPQQALLRPAVRRVGHEVAELSYRALVVAQRGARAAPHRAEVHRLLLDVLRHPLPREAVRVPGERAHRPLLVADVTERQVPGQLLLRQPASIASKTCSSGRNSGRQSTRCSRAEPGTRVSPPIRSLSVHRIRRENLASDATEGCFRRSRSGVASSQQLQLASVGTSV